MSKFNVKCNRCKLPAGHKNEEDARIYHAILANFIHVTGIDPYEIMTQLHQEKEKQK